MENTQPIPNQSTEDSVQQQVSQNNSKLFVVIAISILLTGLITGSIVYFWQRSVNESAINALKQKVAFLQNRLSQVDTTRAIPMPTSQPEDQVPRDKTTSAPATDSSTKLLEPSLVPVTDWQVVSFPQNIIVSQGGENRAGNIEMMIPSNWTSKTVQTRTGEGIGGGACNDSHIESDKGDILLIIKPSCGDSNNDYLPISGQVQKVELIANKGNDSHDSYTVRYYDSSTNTYHYGSISVSPGASIDIQKDQIYPNLVLQYEPDRHEQWLWTSYDLTYQGDAGNQETALNTVDTIISTLKLTD